MHAFVPARPLPGFPLGWIFAALLLLVFATAALAQEVSWRTYQDPRFG